MSDCQAIEIRGNVPISRTKIGRVCLCSLLRDTKRNGTPFPDAISTCFLIFQSQTFEILIENRTQSEFYEVIEN